MCKVSPVGWLAGNNHSKWQRTFVYINRCCHTYSVQVAWEQSCSSNFMLHKLQANIKQGCQKLQKWIQKNLSLLISESLFIVLLCSWRYVILSSYTIWFCNQVGMKCHFIIYQLEINFSACYTIVFYFRKLFKSWREKWKRTFGRIKSSEDTHLPPETEICNALVFMRTGLEENSGYLMLLHGSERLNQSNYFW